MVADALSRRLDEGVNASCSAFEPSKPTAPVSGVPTAFDGTLCIISFPTPTWLSDLKLSHTIDSKVRAIINAIYSQVLIYLKDLLFVMVCCFTRADCIWVILMGI